MFKFVLAGIMLVMVVTPALAEEAIIYETLPGTSVRDYSKPGLVIEDDGEDSTVYKTLPGMDVRDYSKPGYVIENEE